MPVSTPSTRPPRKHPASTRLLAVIIVSTSAAALLIFFPGKNPSSETPSLPPGRKTVAEPSATSKITNSAPGPQTSSDPSAPTVSAESLETLAATHPSRALDLALAEKDDAQRDVLLQAVLRGWARTAPEAAADWAWGHPETIEQGHAFAAIFNGTQQNPDAALRLAQRLSTEHPEQAWSFGRYLVYSFAQAGHFAQAADFAAASHPDHRTDLLTAAYHPWGCQEPEKALQSAIALDDPLRQNAAFHATVDGWAQTNPQSLTEAAYKFPTGNDRTLALVNGLRHWIEKDPTSAEVWVKTHTLTAEESSRALEE